MTEYTAVTDWATIATGQKVRATRDGERVEFTVARIDTFDRVTYINNDMAGIQINSKDHPAWRLEAEKPAVVLPTEPGTYTDSDGDLWRCNGVLWDLVGSTGGWVMAGHILAPALPFTRLRPEAEVAAGVIGHVWNFRESVITATTDDDVRALCSDMRAIYGVTL